MAATRKALSCGFLFSTMLIAGPSAAAELGADAVRNLVGGKMWIAEKMLSTNQLRSFEWKDDGSVCLRLGSTSGRCDDSGHWKIDGARVCWDFTWWMKTYDLASTCLGIAELGKGRYEAKMANGTTFMEFTVRS